MNKKLIIKNSDDDEDERSSSPPAAAAAESDRRLVVKQQVALEAETETETTTTTPTATRPSLVLDANLISSSSSSIRRKSSFGTCVDLERAINSCSNGHSNLEAAGQESDRQQQQQHFSLSPARWTLLFGICVFGYANGISNEVNAILQVYVDTLQISLTKYVYLNQLSVIVQVLVSFFIANFVDKFGARAAIFSAILFATIRNASRALLFSPNIILWQELRFAYWVVTIIFTQLTVVIYYCLPLRLAESWFAERERSLALTLFLVTPILGSASAALLYPHYITGASSAHPLAWINLSTALTSILAVSLTVHRSRPGEGAPSARNQTNLDKLNEQQAQQQAQQAGGTGTGNQGKLSALFGKIKIIVSNQNYLIHSLTLGSFDPLMAAIQFVMQDIFANAGLSKVFCGQFLAIGIVLAAIVQTTGSVLLKPSSPSSSASCNKNGGKTPDIDPFRTRTCKVMLTLQCLMFVIFAHTLILHELYTYEWLLNAQWWLIMVTSVAYILVRYSAAPYYNEQLTETICGTISEPLSGACSMVIYSAAHNLFSIVFVTLRKVVHTVNDNDQGDDQNDQGEHLIGVHKRALYKHSVLFTTGVALFLTLLYVMLFNPKRQAARRSMASGQ